MVHWTPADSQSTGHGTTEKKILHGSFMRNTKKARELRFFEVSAKAIAHLWCSRLFLKFLFDFGSKWSFFSSSFFLSAVVMSAAHITFYNRSVKWNGWVMLRRQKPLQQWKSLGFHFWRSFLPLAEERHSFVCLRWHSAEVRKTQKPPKKAPESNEAGMRRRRQIADCFTSISHISLGSCMQIAYGRCIAMSFAFIRRRPSHQSHTQRESEKLNGHNQATMGRLK